MLATMQRTTTGPRFRGSRFFAARIWRRAPRWKNARPAKRVAGQKTAPRKIFSAAPKTRRENASQTLGTHQKNSVFAYDFASGCAVGPNSAGREYGGFDATIETSLNSRGPLDTVPEYARGKIQDAIEGQVRRQLEKKFGPDAGKILDAAKGLPQGTVYESPIGGGTASTNITVTATHRYQGIPVSGVSVQASGQLNVSGTRGVYVSSNGPSYEIRVSVEGTLTITQTVKIFGFLPIYQTTNSTTYSAPITPVKWPPGDD